MNNQTNQMSSAEFLALEARKTTGNYGNKRQVDEHGTAYDSMAEYRYKGYLDLRKRAGEIQGHTYQVPFPLIVNGIVIGRYVADFVVDFPDGHSEIHDIKGAVQAKKPGKGKPARVGTITDLFKWKAKHVAAQYGQTVICIDSQTFKPLIY